MWFNKKKKQTTIQQKLQQYKDMYAAQGYFIMPLTTQEELPAHLWAQQHDITMTISHMMDGNKYYKFAWKENNDHE